jgi:ketosteroid isomerase-like protein
MHEVFEQSQHLSGEDWLEFWYEHVWAEDIDYRAIEGAPDDRGPIHGRDAMRSYVADWFDTVDDFEVTTEETIDAGENSFVAVIRVSGKIRGGDTPVYQQMAVVWTFGREGKLVRGREYRTREEAMRAAGLSGSGE